jgi:hypothetical protein
MNRIIFGADRGGRLEDVVGGCEEPSSLLIQRVESTYKMVALHHNNK